MTQNEVKQAILSYLKKVQSATAKEIAADLFWTEKTEKRRMNKVLTCLREEGLIEAEKVRDDDIHMMVNTYILTPQGHDAIEPSLEPTVSVNLPPKSLPPKLSAEDYADAEVVSVNLSDEEIGDVLDMDYTDKPEAQEDKLTKWMLVIEGETLIYNDYIEANNAAEQYAIECGAIVKMYALEAQFLGQFEQVTKAIFKSPYQLQQEAA